MASIQILELRPVEAQLEDLSDDMTGRIQGGALVDSVLAIVQQALLLAEGSVEQAFALLQQAFNTCSGTANPGECYDDLL